MITEVEIARINFLAKKSKTEGLTAAEMEEQKVLRKAFIDNIKSQVKQQLESIEYVEDLAKGESCGCGCGEKHHHGHDHHHHEGCGCGDHHHGHHHDHDHEHHEHEHGHHGNCKCGGSKKEH